MKDDSVHVFLTTDLFYPDLAGAMMRFFRYGPGMEERGINFHVITLKHMPELAEEEEVNGIRIHRFSPPPGLSLQENRDCLFKQAYLHAMAIIREGGRAILQPTASWISRRMAFTMFVGRMRGLSVVHQPTMAPEWHLPRARLSRLRLRFCIGIMLAPMNKIVFLSREMGRLYEDCWPLRSSRVRVIPNGVDLSRFRPLRDGKERRDLRRDLGFFENQKIILFVGGIMARKGVDILLAAWEKVHCEHPDAKLVILGSGADRASHQRPEYKSSLEAYLRRVEDLHLRLPVPESVVFLGEVDDPAPYYRMADLFAFPSRHEGLPNAVFEAMASGLPCLVARFGGVPANGEELGFFGRHHLSLGHDAEEWGAELRRLLHNEEAGRLRKLGQEAYEWIEKHHELSSVLDQWASLYRELTNNST